VPGTGMAAAGCRARISALSRAIIVPGPAPVVCAPGPVGLIRLVTCSRNADGKGKTKKA
jgi:hypothetical protein